MGLRVSPISRNLRMNATFLGLEVEDMLAIAFIAIFFLMAGQFMFPKVQIMRIPLNWALFLLTIGVGGPVLRAVKYGKPRGYLQDVIAWHTKPKMRDCLVRDSKLTLPYLKDVGEDQNKATNKKQTAKRAG